MAQVKNSRKNVSAAKGLAGGYLFFAPAGTAAPTDWKTPLPDSYKNLGYVSDDGIVQSPSVDATDHKDMNGDVIDTSREGYSMTVKATLAEIRRDTQAVAYGEANVTDAAGLLTVHDTGEAGERGVLVAELVLKGGRRMRRVWPDAECAEVGEQTMVSSDLFVTEATWNAYKDEATGDYCVTYLESTETEA